jgi:hypothetical protein
MKDWKKNLSLAVMVIAISLFATQAAAQDVEREVLEADRERFENAELNMREAERQMEAAAQRIAELSSEQLARFGEFENHWVFESNRPVLGITIGSQGERGPVEGAGVIGVTPGGAADEAGIRSGDIITALNGESLSSSSSSDANELLLELMEVVDEGEELELDYLRDNKTVSVTVTPQVVAERVFDFRFEGPGPMVAPGVPHVRSFAWVGMHGGHGFGAMEMIELNESLGRYFGTDSGLLIVKTPEDNAYQLQDGDVLKSIDGRTPKDLMHAIRILSSYENGETVNLKILRDKKEKTITIEVPDDRQSWDRTVPAVPSLPAVRPLPVFMPGDAPTAEIIVVPRVKVVKKLEHST